MSKSLANSLRLDSFIPYLFSVFTNRVSRRLAGVYSDRFDLTIPEWRVMAVLNQFESLSASELVAKTEMDKVAISRAISRLSGNGRLLRSVSRDDRRRSLLRLSAEGRRIVQKIEPLALSFEAELLSSLSKEEQAQLKKILNKLLIVTSKSPDD